VLPGPEIVFWPERKNNSANLEKVPPISQKRQCNIHRTGQFEIKLKIFFVSESVSVPLNKELLWKIFFGLFSAAFAKIRPKFGHKSLSQLYYSRSF
jgi:hypothetical protein